MKQYVCGFGFSTSGLWLVKKHEPSINVVGWNGIGGKIEEDEAPESAMRRKWKEEAGMEWPDHSVLACVLSGNHRVTGERYSVFFYSTRLHYDLPNLYTLDSKEPVAFFHPDCLPYDCMPNIEWLVPIAKEAIENPGHGAPYYIETRT